MVALEDVESNTNNTGSSSSNKKRLQRSSSLHHHTTTTTSNPFFRPIALLFIVLCTSYITIRLQTQLSKWQNETIEILSQSNQFNMPQSQNDNIDIEKLEKQSLQQNQEIQKQKQHIVTMQNEQIRNLKQIQNQMQQIQQLKNTIHEQQEQQTEQQKEQQQQEQTEQQKEQQEQQQQQTEQQTEQEEADRNDHQQQQQEQQQDENNKSKNQNTAIPNKGDKPMNIVLLYADDMRHDSLGIAGTQPVLTPFLDRLSTEGIRFTHNCVTTSICWISRATLHTGEYVSSHNTRMPMEPVFYDTWNITFPHLLREKGGYHVGHIGKWNFARVEDIQNKFHYWQHYEGHHWYPECCDGKEIHTTARNERDAIEFLQTRPKNQPFHLTVAFFTPHSVDGSKQQYFPQPQSMELYNNIGTLKPNFNMDESWKRMPSFFTERNEGRIRYHWRFDNETKYDMMLKNYYRLITEIDQTSEKIYNMVKEQGELDNTLFIYTADNGLFHGEHGMAGKWFPHEESIRTPLIIRDPRMPYPLRGTTDDSFTLNIDLYPTLLGAAKIPIPKQQQSKILGRDISDLYLKSAKNNNNDVEGQNDNNDNDNNDKSNNKPWRTEFYYEYPNIFADFHMPQSSALVRKGYKYIRWPQPAHNLTQLFDLKNDPREENDIANDPKYNHIMNEMKIQHDILEKQINQYSKEKKENEQEQEQKEQ